MKKALKILAFTFIILLGALIILPIIFEGKIIELVKKTANNSINATLDFEKADISLLRNFPSTEVTLQNLYITNKTPFEGDTLIKAKKINLKLPFKSLFQSTDESIDVSSFTIHSAVLNLKIDKDGNANYDIAKKDSETVENNSANESFKFNLNGYAITDSKILYTDDTSNMQLNITDFNHKGVGNFASEVFVLKTNSNALVSFAYDSINYLNKNAIGLDADLNLDLKENKYSFLENKALINNLPLVFKGFVKLNTTNKEIDLSFKTPSSDFKNFLALIPKEYSKNIEGVTTTGNFDVNGTIKGVINESHIPQFNIAINSDNASFKYPNLPKSLQNIHINTIIANTTGITKDTYVDIDKLAFTIDNDAFNANAKLTDITENMKVNANLKGILNLAKLEQIYPAEAVKNLKGMLNIDANTKFDMQSIEHKRYENTNTSGNFNLTGFEYASKELSAPLLIKKTALVFNPKTVGLNEFDASLGKTDINAKGTINNLLGFLFNKENLEGRFNVASNTFSVNDFMTNTSKSDSLTVKKTESNQQIKIPSFLDCTVNATANNVLYDNVNLKNVSGTLLIKDQKAELQNMKSDVFGGSLGFNGMVSTKTDTPQFNMTLDVENFDIGQSFTALDLFSSLAPIANAVKGKINTDITLSGDLNNDFTPNLSTLSGNLIAELLSSTISPEATPLLEQLGQKLTFLNTKKLDLNDLKTALSFKVGKVSVKPFTIKYEDIEITVAGSHGFDKSLNYDAVVNVPAKYLGNEASKLISELSNEEQNTIRIPVTALLSGSFKSPTITTDLKSAVANLTKQIANNQKEKLINQGKDKINTALTDLLNKNLPKDSTVVDTVNVKKPDVVKEAAKGLLNNILGGKKKKTEAVKKDTVN